MRQIMRFLNSTTVVFMAIILIIALWIGSGLIGREPPEAPERTEMPLPTVAASWSDAEPVTRELVLYGDVEPVQVSTLRARVDGIVEEIAAQGDRVEWGELLVQLSTDDREARLARAEAQVSAAERDYDAARQLAERDVAPEAEARTRRAELEAARAELRATELEIANTALGAPISGTISRLIADVGSYVTPGSEVLEIVDNDPLIAVVNVQQSQIASVRTGMAARVRFIGGDEREGQVQFVSPFADAATRTFRVEIEITNPDGEIPAGLSAEVAIPLEQIDAHRISAALGRLGEDGRLGIHILDDEDRIQFVPIQVVRARADGIWVDGLPERARIVTISRGSLAPGQQVEARETPEEYADRMGIDVGDPEAEAAAEALEFGAPLGEEGLAR